MTPTDAAYLAGLIDGEGTVTIARISKAGYSDSYSARVTIANTNAKVMEWCRSRGANIRPDDYPSGSWPKKRPVFLAIWYTRKASDMLREVIPYLVIKQPQARVLLDLAELNEERKPRQDRLTEPDIAKRAALKLRVNQLNREKP